MWSTIAGNRLDDPVTRCRKSRAGKNPPSRLLHFPLPSLSASGGPSDSPQRKNQIDAGATDRVLPPHPPNPIRGSKLKAATPSLFPSHLSAEHVTWVARRALRSRELAVKQYGTRPALPAPPASFAPGSHPGRLKGGEKRSLTALTRS